MKRVHSLQEDLRDQLLTRGLDDELLTLTQDLLVLRGTVMFNRFQRFASEEVS